METVTIAVVGNPNSGKTTLFNEMTGSNQRIGNWPGVTVEKKEGYASFGEHRFHFVDLPGIYSLFAVSEDERVARDYILTEKPELVVNILDSTNLERNLYLTTQLIEMKVPVLVILNMMDLADRGNIRIDVDHLASHLQVPCMGISALRKGEDQRVFRAILTALREKKISTTQVLYPNEIEEVISRWLPKLDDAEKKIGTNKRWIASKLLEEEEWTTRVVLDTGRISRQEITRALEGISNILGEPADAVLADYRYGFIHGLVKDVITRTSSRRSITDKIDKVVMNRVFGVPIFFAAMFLVFFVTIGIGESLIGVFERVFGAIFVDGVSALLHHAGAPGWVVAILAGGVGTGIQTVATFIPIIFLLFLMISLLEDSGYMARAAFVMDRFMGMLGLPGKSFVPMIVGFGCTVPAILAARTLESKRDRILTVFMTPFMSCGARLSVYSVFAAVFFTRYSGMVVFSLYLVGIVIAILSGLLLRKTIFLGETTHLIMELPPYHAPRPKHIMLHTWFNLRGFLIRAGKFIVLAAILLSFLNSFGIDGTFGNEGSRKSVLVRIGKSVTPAFTSFGVEERNWPASVALFTGIFAKEAVIGTMNALYGQIGTGKKEARAPEGISTASSGEGSPLEGGTDLPSVDAEGKATAFLAMREYFSKGPLQAYAFLLFVLLYFPCVATLGVAIKEIGKGYGFLMVLYQTFLAWIIATLFYQLTVGHQVLWILVALGTAGLTVLSLMIVGKIVRKRISRSALQDSSGP